MEHLPANLPQRDPPSLATELSALWQTMRPHQWVKNVFVLVPLVFAGPELLAEHKLGPVMIARVALAALCFCLASSATYVLNDLLDADADRAHPVKRLRPIAAGLLTEARAKFWLGVLLAVDALLTLAIALWVGEHGALFGLTIAGYFAQNLVYSLGLKKVAYVDAAIIAMGFLLRVLAGSAAAPVAASHWLLACTALLAMFLALGKRKHEVITSDVKHRANLKVYRLAHLNIALGVLAVLTAAAYLLYTLDPVTVQRFHTSRLPWTTPFGVFGLWRFSRLLDASDTAHSPTERMLHDRLFLANLLAGTVAVALLIYGVLPE
jgi:decaprenyl-phosphate phosphoribosyltransferase